MAAFGEHLEYAPKHVPRTAPDHEGPGGDHGRQLASTLGNTNVGHVLNAGVHRAGATSAQHLDETVARAIEERRGAGRPLDDGTRAEMEGALGHDFSDVRVHTDSDSHDLSEAVSARAFTTGSDLFFKQGTYDPGSSSGKELLAHELTHVVQQRHGASGLGAGEVSSPTDAAEQHAESVGRTVANDLAGAAPAAGPATAGVARQEDDEEFQMARDPVARQDEEEELMLAADPLARDEEEEEVMLARDPLSRSAEDEVEEEMA